MQFLVITWGYEAYTIPSECEWCIISRRYATLVAGNKIFSDYHQQKAYNYNLWNYSIISAYIILVAEGEHKMRQEKGIEANKKQLREVRVSETSSSWIQIHFIKYILFNAYIPFKCEFWYRFLCCVVASCLNSSDH